MASFGLLWICLLPLRSTIACLAVTPCLNDVQTTYVRGLPGCNTLPELSTKNAGAQLPSRCRCPTCRTNTLSCVHNVPCTRQWLPKTQAMYIRRTYIFCFCFFAPPQWKHAPMDGLTMGTPRKLHARTANRPTMEAWRHHGPTTEAPWAQHGSKPTMDRPLAHHRPTTDPSRTHHGPTTPRTHYGSTMDPP